MIDPRRIRWYRVAGFLVWAAFAAPVLLGLVACGESLAGHVAQHLAEKPDTGALKPSGDTKRDEKALAQAHLERDLLAEQMSDKDRQIATLSLAVQRDADRDTQRRLAWVSGAALFAVLACVVLWFLVPAGAKDYVAWFAIGCIALSGAALVLRALVPYRYAIGWAILVSLVLFLLWKLGRWIRAAKAGTQHGDLTEKAVLGESFADLAPEIASTVKDRLARIFADAKAQSARVQDAKGVRHLIAAVRGKPKPPKAVA